MLPMTHQRKDNKNETKGKGESGAGKKKAKKVKKSIYISYSPDASFTEKKFTIRLVQQLKEGNLSEDLWLDKEEWPTDDVSWLSKRLEAIEKSRAVLMVLSKSYISCPVTIFERKLIMERVSTDEESRKPRIFCVIFEPVEFTRSFTETLLAASAELVDLTGELSHLPIEEKTSYAVGALCERLERVASMKTAFTGPPPENTEGTWQQRRVAEWSCNDVVDWLYSIRCSEFFRQAFAEQNIDGYLLLSATDHNLQHCIGIDSRSVRRKITSELISQLKVEQAHPESWHLRSRSARPRRDYVYLVYDPQDARVANNIKRDLSRRGLQTYSHDKLGQSRKEFLQLNGGQLAKCSNVVCLLTEQAATSPFVYQEILFFCWLGGKRSFTTLLFSNVWVKLKNTLKCTIGDCPSIDFEKKLYIEAMDILEHHVKPQPNLSGVVLEQRYVDKLQEGIQPLRHTCMSHDLMPSFCNDDDDGVERPKVFLSYQWDCQHRALQIADALEKNGFPCWCDVTMTPRSSMSRMSLRSSSSMSHVAAIDVAQNESLQSHITRNMKTSRLVVCCLTPKYVVSKNCEQDLLLADTQRKPILTVMLQFVAWPPEGTSEQVRRLLVRLNRPVDLSNEKLFRANLPQLISKVAQVVT